MKTTAIVFLIMFLFCNILTAHAERYDVSATQIHSGVKYYYIMSDNDFSGSARHNPSDNTVTFVVKNMGKYFYPLRDKITNYGVSVGDNTYGLEFKEIKNPAYPVESFYVNPQDYIEIVCYAPSFYNQLGDIKGFFITLKGNRKIRFGYEILPFEEKLSRYIRKLVKGK